MSQDRGPWLSTASGLFFSWASMALAVRVWVKARKHRWSPDDTIVMAAFAVTIMHVASTIWAVEYGFGKPLSDLSTDKVEGAAYVAELSYVVALGLTKVSTALFIGQLTRHRPQIRNSRILAGICGVWAVIATFVVALRGDLRRPWQTMDGTNAMWYRWIAVEATGILLEFTLWGLSINLIWGLQMKLDKRLLILGAFGCRLGLIPIVVFRLIYLSPIRNTEPTTSSVLAGIMTEAALEFALFSTSITALKPFLRPFHTGAIVNTVGGAGSGLYYGSRSNNAYMLGSTKDPKDDYQMNVSIITGGRKQSPMDVTTASSRGGKKHVPQPSEDQNDDIQSIHSDGSDQKIIRTTKEWSVRYEER